MFVLAGDVRMRVGAWIRDLTEEGIEPHPGPRYVTKNLNGVQQNNKLYYVR